MSHALFRPLRAGRLTLDHRVVMAPLTRLRATVPGSIPNDLVAEYYGQRATAGGLIIAEATAISMAGSYSPRAPGIFTSAQVDGWRKVTAAIHAKGGRVVLQLWHVGRMSHASLRANGVPTEGPSAVAPAGTVMTAAGEAVPFETPRVIATSEIAALVAAYVAASEHAIAAGFDGVEIHAANGYLLESFMQSRTNLRTDAYGGSIENRARLTLEITHAIARAIGADRTGIRLSPYGRANDSGEADPMPLYSHIVRELDALGLAYLHLIEPRSSGAGQREVDHPGVPSAAALFRPMWKGALIAAGNFTAESAPEMVAAGHADAIAFGRYFISNPDLPERIRQGVAFTPYDRKTFYSAGPVGYTDYNPAHVY
jgi:N-ethylmaleimide reductase